MLIHVHRISPFEGEVNGQLINGSNCLECVLLVAISDDVSWSMRIVGSQHSRELFLQLLYTHAHSGKGVTLQAQYCYHPCKPVTVV